MFAVQPRAGMPRRSGSIDHMDDRESALIRWKDQIVKQGADELESYVEFQKVEEYIKMLSGEYWSPNRPAFRSKFSDNYLADQRRESLASLSQVRPALDISSSIEAYKHIGEVAHKYTRYLWTEHDLDLEVVKWIDHALFGTGFMKHTASQDHFAFSAVGLDSVIPIQCSDDIQTSAAVIYRAYHGLSYFQSKFGPQNCIGLEREAVHLTSGLGREKYPRPADIPAYRWDPLSPQLKRRAVMRRGPMSPTAGDANPFPVIELLEIYTDDWSINDVSHDVLVKHPDLDVSEHNYHYIVPHGCRLFPRKRLTIFAGNRCMYDGPSPFWHGMYPFTMLQLNPCVWAPGGISKYRDLVPLVKSINRIVGGVDESVMHALNRNIIGKRGAMPEAAWDAFIPGKPGQKLLMNPIYQKGDVSWMDPPIVPAYVGEMLRYLVDNVKRRSGALDIQGLSRKKQAPGGEAIEQMRDSMSGPFQLEGRYVEAAIKRCGRQVVSNEFQYATLSGRLRILGADGMTWEDFDYDPHVMKPATDPKEDFWRSFSVNIAAGSTHGASKMQRKIEALTLRKMGDLSQRQMFHITEFPVDVDTNQKEIAEEHQMGIGVTQGKGRTPRQTRSSRNGGAL